MLLPDAEVRALPQSVALKEILRNLCVIKARPNAGALKVVASGTGTFPTTPGLTEK